ncbi:MAG TPA: MBL fold metallo-hydrolase [Spirochaetota bacterium]|nr:MBL fold metallo-hydrolase [Spirochaetota bacterium]HPS86852.1 MBL fold metallo-hydrolase [Spirochaetota bacterium]
MAFERKECRIENVYLIDTLQFNMETITSVYCYSDGNKSLLMDIGTSDNIDTVFKSLTSRGVDLESIAGIVLSHYHFDHGGGSAELWKRMKDINSDFKIYTNRITKENLQNSAGHLRGAKTTFGKFVGTMDFLPDEAFFIVEPDDFLPVEFSAGERVRLLHTPGHTADHCSPSVILGDRTIFTFAGEALGTIYTNDKMLSTPTSMPPNFNYKDYISSMDKLRSMNPELIGFCHFGIISGADDINFVFKDHREFMDLFRQEIITAFNENPSTSHVLKKTEYLWKDRIDSDFTKIKGSDAFFGNLRLALTYGVMVDLGFRNPKYESKTSVKPE